MPSTSKNEFLRDLSDADLALLRPHLKHVELKRDSILFDAGRSIDRLYFPTSGIVSLVVTLENGDSIEAGMIGRDGVVGASAALDGRNALNRAIVQAAGEAGTIDVIPMREAVDTSTTLRKQLYRHDVFMLAQAQQSAACLAKHDIHSRLCRWLLRSRDLIQSDKLHLTQEFVAQMLGVQRTSVTMIAKQLQTAGMIKTHRGAIDLTDLEAIREASCECYETVNVQKARLLGRLPNAVP